MITNKELVPFVKKVSVLEFEVNALEIKSPDDMKKATILLSNLNKYGDSVTEAKEKLTGPINASLKAIRDMFKPVETYKAMIEDIRTKMSLWQTSETNRMKAEEAKIAARVGEGKGKLKIETAMKKMEDVEKVEKEVATDAGLVQFRESKVLKINNVGYIPREYMVPNEKMILEALKEGKLVPGCEIEIIQIPVNYR
jgi:type I site-specific restriction endonuclease